ncbi:hypothetical protein SNEBB_007766 [Seison nebaliae]|nr:hypothetical protein SNEBB_007766 [Seison nebaliae]
MTLKDLMDMKNLQNYTRLAIQFVRNNLTEILKAKVINRTAINNTTTRKPSTTEGMLLAYISLLFMAVFAVYIGSKRSVRSVQRQIRQLKVTGTRPEKMTSADAAMFPLIASIALFSTYIIFILCPKDPLDKVVDVYFVFLGISALARSLGSVFHSLTKYSCSMKYYSIIFTENTEPTGWPKNWSKISFSTGNIFCCIFSTAVGIWYYYEKHWIANNIFGLALAINSIEILHIDRLLPGIILLSGLFLYDIFWVFGTNVMVSVAVQFKAPIKLIFPQDILEKGLNAENLAMLGLGDIVVPGIFIALLLRYDVSKLVSKIRKKENGHRKKNFNNNNYTDNNNGNKNTACLERDLLYKTIINDDKDLDNDDAFNEGSKLYFYTTLAAYILALCITVIVMTIFKHAQPALLYIVPLCLIIPLGMAIFQGEAKKMLKYEDYLEETMEKVICPVATPESVVTSHVTSTPPQPTIQPINNQKQQQQQQQNPPQQPPTQNKQTKQTQQNKNNQNTKHNNNNNNNNKQQQQKNNKTNQNNEKKKNNKRTKGSMEDLDATNTHHNQNRKNNGGGNRNNRKKRVIY